MSSPGYASEARRNTLVATPKQYSLLLFRLCTDPVSYHKNPGDVHGRALYGT